MCVSPLKILNRSKVQVPGLSSTHYNVPCGQCWQCQQAKRDSFYIRNFFEYLHTKENNGWTLFLTLTYNDENLPKVHGIPCFRKEDVQKYMKRFRMRLTRHLAFLYRANGSPKASDIAKLLVKENIRYFVSSENGEKRHRPHYHILIYCLSDKISPWLGRSIACNSWGLGFAVPSEQNFGFVDSLSGIKYVSKYVGKSTTDDAYYYRCIDVFSERLKRLESQHSSLVKWLDDDKSSVDVLPKVERLHYLILETRQIVSDLSDNKPFLLCSKGLGMFALSKFCPTNYRLTRELFGLGKINISGSDNKSIDSKILPQYYSRKLMYDVFVEKVEDKYNVQYKLNDFGIDLKCERFERYFSQFDENLQKLLSRPLSNERKFLSVVNEYGFGFSSVDDVKSFLTKHIYNPYFKEYALLYSSYSSYFDSHSYYCPLSVNYQPLCLSDVYRFRQYLGSASDVLQLDISNIDEYQSYWYDILSNIHYFHTHFSWFSNLLTILEYYKLFSDDLNTIQRQIDDEVAQHNRWLYQI